MNLLTIQRILGLLLMLFSITMLPPVAVSLHYRDHNVSPFIDAFIGLLVVGFLIWLPVRKRNRDLRLRDGFLVVALFWVVLSLAGAAPLLLADRPEMSPTDAIFEAVAGFTTTGATVLTGLDTLPKSILYYRQQIQWLGGIGMVVLAVALLPMLGVGGMQLLKAETPGPVKNTRLTPRITETAKALWIVYVAITVACAVGFWWAGMDVFDAIAHSFSTVSTGGFSTHDASLGYFHSVAIEGVAIFFMFVGGINFSLHFLAWRRVRLRDYLYDPECRAYTLILIVTMTLCVVPLLLTNFYPHWTEAFRHGIFHAVSIVTSTGFLTTGTLADGTQTTGFWEWPDALPLIMIMTMFIGGCAGSTSGGMKVIRWLLMWKQGSREIVRLVHPNAILPVKLGDKAVDWRIIDAVWGFFAIYVACFAVLMVALMATGVDQITAFSAIASGINNAGPGLGQVTLTFTTMNETGKWIYILAMLLGRLEIYPLLVLIAPAFWRR
ncbi:MAG TPA: TrkH family potassium uptake protein [Steroidobacteraceae bacterium]|nr:TrkH family potassium uptake protein [Steroidobacteraceae bacterium]